MRNLALRLFGFRRWINLYPPLHGAGIRVISASKDLRTIVVELHLTWRNRNYVGTHFGGSLFAMTDPFYMIALKHTLGPGHVVWDKAASIRFRRPGLTSVRANFHLSDERLAEIRQMLADQGVGDVTFEVDVVDLSGEIVAKVERVIYVATREAHSLRKAARGHTRS